MICINEVKSVVKIKPKTIDNAPELFNARGSTMKIFEIRYENEFIKESSLNFNSFCSDPSATCPREAMKGRILSNSKISFRPEKLKIFEIAPADKNNAIEDNKPKNIFI